jgi:O-antigen/teichoic acid export membrane protein
LNTLQSTRLLARNGTFAVLNALFTAAALLVTYRLVTAGGGLAVLGTWSLVYSLTSLAGLADLGLPLAMAREVARLRLAEEWGSIGRLCVLSAFVGVLATSALASLAAPAIRWVVERTILRGSEVIPDGLLLACALTVPLYSLTLVLTGALEGLERYDLKLASLLLGNTAMVVAVLSLSGRGYPTLIAWAFVVQYGFASVGAGLACWRSLYTLRTGRPPLPLRPIAELLGHAVRVGAPLRLAGLAAFFFEPVVRFYFGALGGVTNAGVYEIASRLCVQAHGLISSAIQVLVPRMTIMQVTDRAGSVELFATASRLTAIAALLGFGWLLLSISAVSTFLLSTMDSSFFFWVAVLGAAWMYHVLAAPSYFANIADGTVHWNWLSQWTAVVVSAISAPLAWLIFGWTALVAGPFLGLVAATLVALGSRRRRTRSQVVYLPLGAAAGVFVATVAFGLCQWAAYLAFDRSVFLGVCLMTLVCYAILAIGYMTRSVRRLMPATVT